MKATTTATAIALTAALTTALAQTEEAANMPDNIIWCTEGYDEDAYLAWTESGFVLHMGSTVERLETDGTSTPHGGAVYDSDKSDSVVILPAKIVFGHNGEHQSNILILRGRVFWPCESDGDE